MDRACTRILIANRGEIARRIVRTVRDMGLESVAVFSDADAGAAHVEEADAAVRIGPGASRESYLDIDAILTAARISGADAVHPGYGFLSENARFARACRDAGLLFIGPSADAIERMGRKNEAKAIAHTAGVPVLDGFALDGLGPDEVRTKASSLGLPLLIKATAGGGGKGMRTVRDLADLDDAVTAARRESESAFGDGALLLEPYLEGARHVEVQVFADRHGSTVHLFERDCSAQRRHQKIFEEAPSPAVNAALRIRLGDAAIALAEAVDYEGAGTVEFLLDADGRFFFLEMNTRLQVEHPVTEAITGLDLVRLQIDVARGRPLPFAQNDLDIRGHAIEARIYAEDPNRDFLPSTGVLRLWREPQTPGVRVDSGVREGDEVTVHYDPMLAKVIAHGADRDEALRRLRRALLELAMGGVASPIGFLLNALEHPHFQAGALHTRFVDEQLPPGRRMRSVTPEIVERHAFAAALFLIEQRSHHPSPLPSSVPAGWRNLRWRPAEQRFVHGDDTLEVRYTATAPNVYTMSLGGSAQRSVRRSAGKSGKGGLRFEVDGLRAAVQVGASRGEIDGGTGITKLSIHGSGSVTELDVVPRFPPRHVDAVAGGCVAPMTGLVLEVRVREGDRVRAGDTLVILEAMKMEHRLQAAHDGVVEAVRVEAKQMVDPDDVLVVVTADAGDGQPEASP